MIRSSLLRRIVLTSLTGLALAVAAVATPIVIGSLTPAQAQLSDEFSAALDPYGRWLVLPRWGEVWIPDDRSPGWRPYTEGHWVYTDEWGWYWVSDEEEADWGWITYHYGRWAHDRRLGWFWIPGDEWAPAWVDWRRGDDYVGWAPLPPEEYIDEYDDDPAYWIFVAPQYLVAQHVRRHFLPRHRMRDVIRRTVVINRTVIVEHDHHRRRRIAVNAGISPAFVAHARRRPVHAFRVRPHVLARTQGVAGAVVVHRDQLRRRQPGVRGPRRAFAPKIERTTVAVQPAKTVTKPRPLGKHEHGRLGSHPPRAAHGGVLTSPQLRRVTPPPQVKPEHRQPTPTPRPQPQHRQLPPPTHLQPQHRVAPPSRPHVQPQHRVAPPPQVRPQHRVAPAQQPHPPVVRHPTPPRVVHPAPAPRVVHPVPRPRVVHPAPRPRVVHPAPQRHVAPPHGRRPPPKGKPGNHGKDKEKK